MDAKKYQLLPPLAQDEYEALKQDIAQRGVLVPVEYDDEGNILDGHHRVRACEELGIKEWPSIVRIGLTEEQKLEHVLKLNIHRRHLSKEWKQHKALELRQQGWSSRKIAECLGVNQSTVVRWLCVSGDALASPETPDTLGLDGKTYTSDDSEKRKRVLELREQGKGIREIARETGIPFQTVHRWCSRLSNPYVFVESDRIQKVLDIVGEAKTKAPNALETPGRLRLNCVRKELARTTVSEPGRLEGKYRVIYADPPWKYGNTMPDYFGEQGYHYPLMSVDEICALPVKDIAEDNSVLFLWATSPILEDAFKVIRAWGFEYKASFVWDKVKHVMGHYNSVRHEFLLLATRGSCLPDVPKLFDSVVVAERGEHSEKPEVFRHIIDTLYPNGRRIELFARKAVEGWDAYGNQLR